MERGKVLICDPGDYVGLLIRTALRGTQLSVVNQEPVATAEIATRIIGADKQNEIDVAVITDALWRDKRAKGAETFVRRLRELHPRMGIVGIYRDEHSALRRHEVSLNGRISHNELVNTSGVIIRDYIQREL